MIMIKNSIFFLSVFCCIVFLFSCEQEKVTYQDCVEEEQAIINNFINDHEVIVLKEYPGNGVFHKNEFVKLENGVYLHVIDSGNGNRPVSGTKIQSFAEGCILGKDSMINFDGFRNNKDFFYYISFNCIFYLCPFFVSSADFESASVNFKIADRG